MTDHFKNFARSITGPADHAEAVTPSDTTDLLRIGRALWIGGAGDVRVTMNGGDVVTFANLSVGWHPLRVSRIWQTGTTATDMMNCS